MATISTSFTITTTAQVIVNLDNVTQYVVLHSKGSSYIGDSAVTTASGIHLENGDTWSFTLPEGCDLWAVAATSSHDLACLITRVD